MFEWSVSVSIFPLEGKMKLNIIQVVRNPRSSLLLYAIHGLRHSSGYTTPAVASDLVEDRGENIWYALPFHFRVVTFHCLGRKGRKKEWRTAKPFLASCIRWNKHQVSRNEDGWNLFFNGSDADLNVEVVALIDFQARRPTETCTVGRCSY